MENCPILTLVIDHMADCPVEPDRKSSKS